MLGVNGQRHAGAGLHAQHLQHSVARAPEDLDPSRGVERLRIGARGPLPLDEVDEPWHAATLRLRGARLETVRGDEDERAGHLGLLWVVVCTRLARLHQQERLVSPWPPGPAVVVGGVSLRRMERALLTYQDPATPTTANGPRTEAGLRRWWPAGPSPSRRAASVKRVHPVSS